MTKGIIYYTDNRLSEPIFSTCQNEILKSNLPITSVSLKSINFGDNYVLDLERGYITMVKQITLALEKSESDIVFFCEHDVLYPKSHFDFIPEKKDIFYYNQNVWRWDYPTNLIIRYKRLISLSGLCVYRNFALNHYRLRLKKINEITEKQKVKLSNEPLWARRWGYEPGTKKIKRGGFSDDDFETWSSKDPMIDIRHGGTFSQRKVTLNSFIHRPENWEESTIDKIKTWNLQKVFNI